MEPVREKKKDLQPNLTSDVGIIGAGASGLTAAYFAGSRGLRVTVLEKKEQAGKKLLITGNGRCNFSNERMDAGCYHASDCSFMERFLKRFSTEDAVRFFESLGMLSAERNGYLYPSSLQAATVVFTLTEACKRAGVSLLTNTEVSSVKKQGDLFEVHTAEGQTFRFKKLVLACGSPSGVKDRNPFNAYDLLKGFGLEVKDPLPALVNLTGRCGFEKLWAGIRLNASVEFHGKRETGEVQFTDSGISGIPVFQLSGSVVEELAMRRKAGEKEPEAAVILDLLPAYSEESLRKHLNRLPQAMSLEDGLRLFLPRKLVPVVLKKADLSFMKTAESLSKEETGLLVKTLKAFVYPVTGHGSFLDSQVTRGGLRLTEITEDFEVRNVPGLHVTGELLDIDGLCGGYNLHFAWGSGRIAGEHL